MAGRRITLTGVTLSDASAPKLAATDPIEAAGSLLLIDPMHPALAWASGVPASGSTVTNLLAAMLGVDDPTYVVTGGFGNGTNGKVERSTRGGLHGIVSQAQTLGNTTGARIVPGASLSAYIFSHPTHSYYLSVWDRLTRAAPSDATVRLDYATHNTVTRGIAHAAANQWYGPAIAARDQLGNDVGPRFGYAVGSATVLTTTSVTTGALPAWGAPTLTFNAANIATVNNTFPSFILYRVYLEDLTVSGRSWQEVAETDDVLFAREVLTTGGRYYGDTVPTDPATIP
jgi:hypothetical protein